MSDRQEWSPSPDATAESRPGSDADRVFLLECRLEQMRASVDEARAEAHRARELLAEATARAADQARRHLYLQEELAAAREEIGSLHRRLEHSEALRAGLEGRLFESTTPEDAQELVRLRGEVAASRDLTDARQQIVTDLRTRVEELVASRETLLTRVSEWQCAARDGDIDAIDLAEFIAALRHDILELEHRNARAEQREAELREQLRQAGAQGESGAAMETAPETGETALEAGEATLETGETALEAEETTPQADESEAGSEEVQAAAGEGETGAGEREAGSHEPEMRIGEAEPLAAGEDAESRIEALLRLGRSGKADAFYAIRSWLVTPEPRVRAAAYQALGQLLEHEPSRLEPHIRWGIADADPRVRRRVVLAAATARGLDLRPLLDPLRRDPDAQVRRVVQEVLRRTRAASESAVETEQIKSGVAS